MAKKILIVEDDDYLRELYADQLKEAGYEVIQANDGREALEKTSREEPDLMLLDIMLPVMNGMDVLKRVKEDKKMAKTKVVLLTSLGQEGIIKEGFSVGAEGYLIKPALTPDQVIAEVKKFFSS